MRDPCAPARAAKPRRPRPSLPALQVLLYMRRRPAAPVDLELILHALLAAVDVFSAVLAAVLALVSLYWLALAKLQARGCWGRGGVTARRPPVGARVCRQQSRTHPWAQSAEGLMAWLHRPPPRPQAEVHLLVPPDSEMYNFWVTMVLAVVGQSVGLLWVLYQQVK